MGWKIGGWVGKTWNKATNWVENHTNEILGVATLGASVPFTTMRDDIREQRDLAKQAAAEQARYNAEMEALAKAQGVAATADNAGEIGTFADPRRRRGYLGTLKGQKDGTNTLLAAAATYGTKKTFGA